MWSKEKLEICEVNKIEKDNFSPVGNRTYGLCDYNNWKIDYTNIQLASNTAACGGNCYDNWWRT